MIESNAMPCPGAMGQVKTPVSACLDSVGINGSEHSANDVKRPWKIRAGIHATKPDALLDFCRERMRVVLKRDAVKHDFVGSHILIRTPRC